MSFSFNYLLYGIAFVALCVLNLWAMVLVSQEPFSCVFFSLSCVFQALLEAGALCALAALFAKISRRALYAYFVFVTILLLLHLVDVPFVRLFDMSSWYAIGCYTEDLGNFLEALYAANEAMSFYVIVTVSSLLLIVFGAYLFALTQKRLLLLSWRQYGSYFAILLCLYAGWEYTAHRMVTEKEYRNLERFLPWKAGVFGPKVCRFVLKGPLKPMPQKKITGDLLPLAKPDVYLFIIESLREDYLTEKVSPHLYRFKRENRSSESSLANSNATHLSWFSIFFSELPFYWKEGKESLPLDLFKRLGYQIHVFSSSRLCYHNIGQQLFGKSRERIDSLHAVEDPMIAAHDRDVRIMEALSAHVAEKKPGGNLYITFLDGTHFGYSFPEKNAPFTPYASTVNYLKIAFSKIDLEPLKNRYRNAIFALDELFGTFCSSLKDQWDQAVIVVTSDHGEEFFEPSNMFHTSRLSRAQTHIPLYYKFSSKIPVPQTQIREMSSHIDIFPTLLHYLLGKELPLFRGTSVFSQGGLSCIFSSRYNVSRAPGEFCMNSKNYVGTFCFNRNKNVLKAEALSCISLTDAQGRMIIPNAKLIREEFGAAFFSLFGVDL